MTLKEKFQKWHDSLTNETVAENIIELEKIADDYAIEFLKFTECTYSFGSIAGKWYSHANTLKKYTTEELLKIFKKEKGL